MANMAGGAVSRATARVLLGVLACWSVALHAEVLALRLPAQLSTPELPNQISVAEVPNSISAPQVFVQAPAPQVAAPVHSPQISTNVSAPVPGERLSDWLLRQPSDPRAYPTGLLWQVPSERYAQAGLKRNLLIWLAVTETAPAAARANLTRMIKALPVTGRLPVPRADARWLQAHPKEDPVLQYNHALALPQLPRTVSVLTNEGKRCTLPHRTGSEARDYLRACEPGRVERMDRAWVVQADGAVRNFGIARWNAQAQDEAAPGALIWAPARDAGWSPQFSTMLAEFLATQGYDTLLAADAPPGVEPVSAVMPDSPTRDAVISANDWGLIGLLQTPTARMAKAGEARFHYSRVHPYERSSVLLQPLDWLEAGFRYTNIRNRLYGSAELSGNQTYKDKSVDVKIRLMKETARLPQFAVGITDVGGTGLFSSEYLVANKRSGNFDWSLGMGWGYMGSSGNISNPLSLLGKDFDTRAAPTGPSGGDVNTGLFFRGAAALFGGVQYHSPSEKWLFKAEYDGNNYQREPQTNNQAQRTPINLGIVYQYNPGVDIAVGFQRGDTLMLGLTWHTPLDRMNAPKVSDMPTPRIVAGRPTTQPVWVATASDISAMSGWPVRQISREGNVLEVVIDGASGAHWNNRIERMTAVLHRDAPAEIHKFIVIFAEQGIPMAERVILREPWVKQNVQRQVMPDRIQPIFATEPRAQFPTAPLWDRNEPRFAYSIVPSWQQNLGGPDGFLLFKAGVAAPARLKLSEDTSITGAVSLALLDNFDKFKYTGFSNLPRVRTLQREYMTTSPVTVPNLQVTHMGKLGGNQFYSVYGGYLESMFAGVGGEWLYRPWHSPFAFGIDANLVQQRNFQQDFGFKNAGSQTGYRVATGHATAYWDTGWKSTQVKLNVGRYLAGDMGATLDIGRSFNNGVTMGAWATKTNVSSIQFGEGSFDKGIYLRIPFDVMTTSRGGGVANLVYNPLTRDGGARLNRSIALYNTTISRSRLDTGYAPAGARAVGGPDE